MKVDVSSQEKLDRAYLEYGVDHVPCNSCSNAIWYPTTIASYHGEIFKVTNSNSNTSKKVGRSTYYLRLCYSCLIKAHPEARVKNPSKLFNTCSPIVKTAFFVSDEDYLTQRKSHAVTKEKIGEAAWSRYVDFQRTKNTYRYKKRKYGWSKDEFEAYNKARAITLANLTSKYGEILGLKKWEEYLAKQRWTKSFEYMSKRYGEETAKSINASKALTEETFIRKYGTIDGPLKFQRFIDKTRHSVSKASQFFFKELDERIKEYRLTTYFDAKNKEFGKKLSSGSYCKVDYYVRELNLAIEYFGDFWHANPKLYEADRVLYSQRTASDIWKIDLDRLSLMKTDHAIETLIVWQSDVNNDLEHELNRLTSKIDTLLRNRQEH